ncbi:uncharacterized protein VNE69_11043 [Vairimorpha necatrix]|uniref:Uncharacterized protein n=1 Tax=Vairimorpha necatrix TaxID=6039 RepID=A0AAX4JFZ8_9MICR
MDIFQTFTSFLFVVGHWHQQAYDSFNTVIINKIKNGDYWEIDTKKTYSRVFLSFDKTNYQLIANALVGIRFSIEDVEPIKVNCMDKSIRDIVAELEDKLIRECNKLRPDFVVLIYQHDAYCENSIFNQIIGFLIQENLERKNKNNLADMFYEYIIECKSLWSDMYVNLYYQNYNNEIRDQTKSTLTFIKKENLPFIHLYIEFKNVQYLFEINAEEIDKEKLYTFIDMRRQKNNELDEKIGGYLHKLYKNVYFDDIDVYSKKIFEVCTPVRIEFEDNDFSIEIVDDKIHFSHQNNLYIHSPINETSLFRNAKNDENKWIMKFKRILEKICEINEFEERRISIEMFFIIIEYRHKVTFFIERILNTKGSPLNVLLGHLLLFKGLINEIELQDITKNEGITEEKRMQLCKKLEKILSNDRCYSCAFTIKICLFIEVEKYINKESAKNGPEFKILCLIGDLMEQKKKEQSISKNIKTYFSMHKNKIDLIKIFEELVKNHLQRYKKNQLNVWVEIFKIASLFTGSDETEIRIKNQKYYTYKKININEVRLDEEKVEKNNEIIRNNLFENNRERRKTGEEIINMLQRLNIKDLSDALNELKDEAIKKKVEDIFVEEVSKNFGDEIIEIGEKIIEKNLKHEIIEKEMCEKFGAHWNKEYKSGEEIYYYSKIFTKYYWINEHISNEKEKLHHGVKILIKENKRQNIKYYLVEALRTLFENDIFNHIEMKERKENNLYNIRKFEHYKGLHKTIDELTMINLHDDLVATLKNNK